MGQLSRTQLLLLLSALADTGAVSLQRDGKQVDFFPKVDFYYMCMAVLLACLSVQYMCAVPQETPPLEKPSHQLWPTMGKGRSQIWPLPLLCLT